METNNKPIYFFELDENGDPQKGVNAIALVDRPAIMSEWVAFGDQSKVMFAIQNEERRIVTGAVLIPNLPIFRKDPNTGEEYYIVATAPVIEKMAMKFMRENRNQFMKDTHDATSNKTKGVYLFESFITDEKRGIVAPKGFEHPFGTWYISCKMDNDIIWNKVKNGEFTGFSMEGFLDMRRMDVELTDEEINIIIKSLI